MNIKPPADVMDFKRKNCASTIQNPDGNYAEAQLIYNFLYNFSRGAT